MFQLSFRSPVEPKLKIKLEGLQYVISSKNVHHLAAGNRNFGVTKGVFQYRKQLYNLLFFL